MKLPLPETPKQAAKIAVDGFFKMKLLLEWNAFAPAFYHHDGWWVRCSVQVWNNVGVFFTDYGTDNRTKSSLGERL